MKTGFDYSLLYKQEGNWTQLTFEKTSGTVIRDRGKNLSIAVSQCYRHPSVLGIPFPKTLGIWASPVTQITKVIGEGNAHITRVLGMGMPKTRGNPYHCNNVAFPVTIPETIAGRYFLVSKEANTIFIDS